jgi:hypothetical protein
MTATLVQCTEWETVAEGTERLRTLASHAVDLCAIAVVDSDGRLLDDVTVLELLLAGPGAAVSELIGPPWPVAISPDMPMAEVALQLIEKSVGLARGRARRWSPAGADPRRRRRRRAATGDGAPPAVSPGAVMTASSPADAVAAEHAPDAVPPAGPNLRRRLILVLAILGPGLIGQRRQRPWRNCHLRLRGGAVRVPGPVVVLIVSIGLVVVQEMCARLGATVARGSAR